MQPLINSLLLFSKRLSSIKSGPETERLRKNVIKTFKECGLNITSKSKLKTIDYLDVTFDLQSNSYKPYRKPDNLPVYIHKDSNHPPSILRELPKTIAKRLSDPFFL